MRKTLYSVLAALYLIGASVQVSAALRTADAVEIKAGIIQETVVLANDRGELFLEFLKDDRVAKSLDQQIYDGQILPPIPVDAPAKAPRARMREVLSFEIISDTNEPLELIDQYSALHAKDRLRVSLSNAAGQRRQGAQLITTFAADQNISHPALWSYNALNNRQPWLRLGGIMGDAPEAETQVFSAFLYGTGAYTIWDENPAPDFTVSFPNDEIELAEVSPYPSVEEETTLDESEFVEALTGEDALLEDELNDELVPVEDLIGDLERELLIPAVEALDESGGILIPAVVTSQLGADPQAPISDSESNLKALPSGTTSPLGSLLSLPTTTDQTIPATETSLGQNLQASTFTDFGVDEGDLPEAGGFSFPWALFFAFGVIGFSVYAIWEKPY